MSKIENREMIRRINSDEFFNIFIGVINDIPSEFYGKTERMFCYELYYKLQKRLEHFTLNNIRLHGELPKGNVTQDELTRLGIDSIPNMYPDFLLHEEETTDYQLAAIEVKASKSLYHKPIFDDLAKLNLLKSNYHFEKVIFLSINFPMRRIENIINKNIEKYTLLDMSNIIIVNKEKHDSDLIVKTLSELVINNDSI